MLFYAVFVFAVAVHAPIGLRTVIAEMRGSHGRGTDVAMLAFAACVDGARPAALSLP
jgi:fumarate reductase subunit C